MKDLTCPYCGHEQDAEEMHEPDTLYEIECEECQKIFGVNVEWEPTYYCKEAPCLNGEPHEMHKTIRFPRVIGGRERWHCMTCDHTENRPSECSKDCDKDKAGCWECDDKESECGK
jgi:transcription elongation factor Elf1